MNKEETIDVNAENVKFALRVLTEFDWVKIFNDLYGNKKEIEDLHQQLSQREINEERITNIKRERHNYLKALNEIREICTTLRGDNYPMSKIISDVVEIIDKALGSESND